MLLNNSYEYEFNIEKLKTDISVALRFNKIFRYIDDLLSINNSNFGDFVKKIYPLELEELNSVSEFQHPQSFTN